MDELAPAAYPFRMEKPLHTVVETNAFLATAKRVGLSDEARTAIVNQVAAAPQDGDLVQGSGGVRKIRFAESGGYRVMVLISARKRLPIFWVF